MLRALAFLAVAALLILAQSNLFRVLGPLASVTGLSVLQGATPSLVLPLVIFLGVHESSMPRGAGLSFAIGYAQDLLGGAPVGLFTFIYVMIWWLSRVAGVRLTAQTVITRMTLGLVFALVETAVVLVLLAVFGSDNRRPVEMAHVALPHAIATALFAPALFRLAQRMRQTNAPPRPHAEATT